MLRRARVGLHLRFARTFLRRNTVPFTDVLRNVGKVLVRPPAGPGELLFCLPALAAIRRTYPRCEVTVLVPDDRTELVNATRMAEHIITYEEPLVPFTGNFKNLRRGLKRAQFDLYLDFNRPEDENRRLFASIGAAKVRVGNGTGGDFPYLNWEVRSSEQSRDEVKRSLSMLSWTGETTGAHHGPVEYQVAVGDKLWADEFLISHSSLAAEKRVMIDLSLPRRERGWDVRDLTGVIRGLEQLCSPRLFVILPREGDAEEILSQISSSASRQVIRVDEAVMKTASLMKRCDLILCSRSDFSSLAHILGLPCILLVLDTDRFYPPEAEGTRVFRIRKGSGFPSGEIVGAAAALVGRD